MSQSKPYQIVYLREALKKWRQRGLLKAYSFSDLSVATDDDAGSVCPKRWMSMPVVTDGGSSRGGSSTGKVPAGHLAVYVGEERTRFVIKTSYLSHPLFRALLKKTEEEIGFQSEGGLVLACGAATFEHLLSLIQSSCKALHRQNSMRGNVSAADEQPCAVPLHQLLETADLSQAALPQAAHPMLDTSPSYTLSQAVVA